MTYSFRFQLIENITKAGGGISRTFQSMARQAQTFAGRVNVLPRSIDQLESELKQLQAAQRQSFDAREVRRYGQEIESVQNRIRRLRGEQQETRPGLMSRLGVGGGVGRAVATFGAAFSIGAMAQQAVGFNDQMVRANGLVAGIMRSEEGIVAAQRQAFQLAGPLNLSRQNSLAAMAEMLTVTQGNVGEAGNLVKTAKALEALNPAEGFEGAVFALKEIQSGDTMSLRERFNIRVPTQEEAKKIAAKDGRSIQQVMFDSLGQYLDKSYGGGQSGQGVEFLLNIRANTIGGQMQRIANSFQNIFTPMLLPFMERLTGFLKGVGDWVQANEGAIKDVLGGIVDTLAPLFGGLYEGFKLLINEAFMPAIGWIRQNADWMANLEKTRFAVFRTAIGWIRQNADWIANLAAVVGIAIVAQKAWNFSIVAYRGIALIATAVTGGLTGVTAALNAVFWANPIAWVIGLIGGLAVAVVYAWNHFAGFRGFLVGMWSVFKEIGSIINDYLIQPLMAMGQTLVGVLTFDTSMIADGLARGMSAAQKIMDGPGIGQRLGTAWGSGFSDGANSTMKIDPLGMLGKGSSGPEDPRSAYESARDDRQERSFVDNFRLNKVGGANAGGGIGVNNQLEGAVSGDRTAVKNITINIGKQVETLTFHTSNLPESADKIRQVVEATLLAATNDSNYSK